MTVKENILELLETHRDSDLSGQVMAKKAGVSRNAVWKAINALRSEGYEILSSPRRGYRLSPDCDILSEQGIRAHLSEDLPVIVLPCVDSTNAYAKRCFSAHPAWRALFVANEQTAGRGRRGREFYSPRGGVYMTFAFSPRAPLQDTVFVTAAASVAVLRAIESVCGVHPMIKWVNDLYLDGKKVCGILTEAVTDVETGIVEYLLIGVGINCGASSFPPQLHKIACSLQATGDTRARLIAAVTDQLCRIAAHPEDRSFMALYRERMLVLDKEIEYEENNRRFTARAVDVDASGGLVVRHADGSERVLRSGEITVRLSDNRKEEIK